MDGRDAPGSRRPPRQRRLALLVLLAAVALAVAAYPLRARWWGGLVLAIAEAGIVGGLADWFAVTALFRHPLGLPIPHTAIIPANWELMAQRVGTMVGDRVLTKEYVTQEIARFDIADLLARGAERMRPADLEAVVRAIASWAAEQVTPAATGDVTLWLTRLARANPIAPLLATAIEIARKQGWDQRLIEAVAAALIEALERPDFRASVGDLVDEVLAGYRARMGVYPRLLMGLANTFGLIDRDRLVSALHNALKRIADDPDDPLRRRLTETLAALPERLRADPDLAARVEAAKEELLASPAVARLLEDAAAGLRKLVLADLDARPSELVSWIAARLDRARRTLAEDTALRRSLDRWLKERLTGAVDRYHDRIAHFIERGVHALGPEGAVRLVEEHAGDDLQYIRVNGTVVGGLAGGGLYAIHLLLELL
ncbi:MAG TPA: DUF445 domain-containing protein [Methylomirabilota bacterium]|nr:DUF445 domain-containing protein [Methylomirabilota bacterium]